MYCTTSGLVLLLLRGRIALTLRERHACLQAERLDATPLLSDPLLRHNPLSAAETSAFMNIRGSTSYNTINLGSNALS